MTRVQGHIILSNQAWTACTEVSGVGSHARIGRGTMPGSQIHIGAAVSSLHMIPLQWAPSHEQNDRWLHSYAISTTGLGLPLEVEGGYLPQVGAEKFTALCLLHIEETAFNVSGVSGVPGVEVRTVVPSARHRGRVRIRRQPQRSGAA